MKKTPLLPVIGALFLLSVGCADRRAQDDPHQALLDALEDRQRAMAQGDIERIFSFWTDDIAIYPVSEPVVSGIAAVRNYVRRNREELGLRPQLAPSQVVASQSADLGYIVGAYEWIDREGRATRPGRYVELWHPDEQGHWRCFLEIHSPAPVEKSEKEGSQ